MPIVRVWSDKSNITIITSLSVSFKLRVLYKSKNAGITFK